MASAVTSCVLRLPRTIHPFVRSASHYTPSNIDLKNLYDIVIIGGGIAGTALACALAHSPISRKRRVALIEAQDLSSVKNWKPEEAEYSNRVSSLTPASYRFFKEIGVWDKLRQDRVWDGITDARITFNTSLLQTYSSSLASLGATTITAGAPAIAWMVENLNMQWAIMQRLDKLCEEGARCDVFANSKVESIERDAVTESGVQAEKNGLDLGEWPIVRLGDGRVGADGVNSPVRTFAGIDSLGWDYDRQGVVATLHVDPSCINGTAWQRFLPTGPIAMLPLKQGYSTLVWSTTTHLAASLRALPPAAFVHLVNAAFRSSLPDLKYLYSQIDPETHQPFVDFGDEVAWREGVATYGMDEQEAWEREQGLPPKVVGVQERSRAGFPLKMRNAERYVGERVVLVGRTDVVLVWVLYNAPPKKLIVGFIHNDAAHAMHPLAGQGLNQGLLDVQCLAGVLEDGFLNGGDIGNVHLLSNYSSNRYARNLAMLGAVDKLHRLFGTEFKPIVLARSLGLRAVDSVGPLKAEIMRYAMAIEPESDAEGATRTTPGSEPEMKSTTTSLCARKLVVTIMTK
ncbi:hypothetical protein BC937DRAFT_88084 [Endogone sp. FLAS-F59071]|nr:hypothetical protein BC937DRAFT_88084 [Endogone sp. FLAS-F59071]|eukprot:RUS19000.1 hypothetical protein BC937DRAFT_88084 [Endogone sp. FLAS-F59071]